MAFPLDTTGGVSAPSYYATNSSPQSIPGNAFYSGGTVIMTLSQATPNHYDVYNYDGTLVTSGSLAGTTLNLGHSLSPGWYRVRYSGSSTDSTYGPSYGANLFTVMRSDAHLPVPPAGTPGNGAPGQHGSAPDFTSRGKMGIPSPRMTMAKAVDSDSTGNDSVAVLALDAPYATAWWSEVALDTCKDANRPRRNWAAFPNRSWDKVDILKSGGGTWGSVYPANETVAPNANNIYVAVDPGSVSGNKVRVYYPNNTTLVETYDNLANVDAASAAVNGVSAYIYIQVIGSGSTAATTAAVALGNAFYNGLAYASSTLMPLGVRYYEGPINEPGMNDTALAQKCRLFRAGIKGGNSGAVVTGPSPVDIVNNWSVFFAGGGHQYLDELSFHDYNTFVMGNMCMARTQIENMIALKNRYAPGLPMAQTEAMSAFTCNGGGASSIGLFMPRVSSSAMLKLIVWEQYGVPKERNSYWYDYSGGFWSVAAFQWTGDGGPLPITVLQRVLSEEVFGKQFSYRLDMGSVAGNAVATGSVYKSHAGSTSASTVVLIAASHIPSATVDLNIVGTTAALTVVDAFGNTSTVTPSAGVVTVPIDDVPTYIELPAGVTCSVHQFMGWGTSPNPSVSRSATTSTLGGSAKTALCDDAFMTQYTGGTSSPGVAYSGITVPDAAILLFPSTIVADRVIVFNPCAWQASSVLTTFTVDTTTNSGSSWTTGATVDVSADAVSTQFGTTGATTGCGYETFWKQQRIFPVELGGVSCNGIRISVSETSYGGSPDQQSWHTNSAAVNEQRVAIEEIMVVSASAPSAGSINAPANTILPMIGGDPSLGCVAACSSGTWTNQPTSYSYQWQRDGSNIAGQTSPEHLVVAADVGHDISCIVTAGNLAGSAAANSGTAHITSGSVYL